MRDELIGPVPGPDNPELVCITLESKGVCAALVPQKNHVAESRAKAAIDRLSGKVRQYDRPARKGLRHPPAFPNCSRKP